MKYCTVCKAKYDDGVSFCPVDGEVLEEDPSSIVGTVLDGQYKIESLLGKGGMGAVYLARHILLGDRVAIKILPPEVRTNAEWLRRFRREGQAARRFRHANAVTVYDLRTAADGTIYMVMEYVEGQTLDAELKKRVRFSPAEALEVLEPIMSVLNTAHEMGVVHRDLKPENIMIGKATSGGESTVKLLDLGIAKMREIAGAESVGTTELTMAGQVLGTPYYMSPEQWGEISRDGNFEIDGRADIYSLGLVAYQMISGRRPYSSNTLHELRREHLQVVPPPLDQVAPGVPTAFSEAITRSISKDRADRQQTAGQLAEELRTAVGTASETGSDNRSLADLLHPERSADTHGAREVVDTKSDVNAPTIVTMDAVPTTPPAAGAPPKPPPVAPPPQARQSDRYVDQMASSMTVPQQRPLVVEIPQAKSRGKTWLLVVAGVVVVGLLLAGVGGIFAFNWFRWKPAATATLKEDGPTTTAASTEFGRYWLEVLPPGLVAEPTRVAGSVPLKSGQAFKFHFQLAQDGYLYIVGPGQSNKSTAFLTAKPAAISGLENNRVISNDDFSFPSGLEHWLELDKKPGTENYTIIFSPAPLSAPQFLSAEATGEPLSDTERAEFANFVSQYKNTNPVTELNDKDAASPYVAIKVPQSNNNKPVVFDVQIRHQ